MIRTSRLAIKSVVRDDTAIVTSDWRSHLAADLAADHVAGGKNVRHVCAQEFVHMHLAMFANRDA